MLYHILTESQYNEYKNSEKYEPESFKNEGFIHLAYREQVQKVIDCFFGGITDVYLLEINKQAVANCLKDEPPIGVEDDGILYPHLYSPLYKRAVIKSINLTSDAKGKFKVTL